MRIVGRLSSLADIIILSYTFKSCIMRFTNIAIRIASENEMYSASRVLAATKSCFQEIHATGLTFRNTIDPVSERL